MISIRKKIINAGVRCRIAGETYNTNRTAKNLRHWNEVCDKRWDLTNSKEGTDEIMKNGVVTEAEIEAAYNKKMGK